MSRNRNLNPRIFIEGLDPGSETIEVSGETAERLVRVLRVREGDTFEAMDGRGNIRELKIISMSERSKTGYVVTALRVGGAIPPRINPPLWSLAQGILKGSKMDQALSFCSELGLVEFIPFFSRRTVPDPAAENRARLDRWRKIAVHGVEVSGGYMPRISSPASFEKVVGRFQEFEPVIIFWEGKAKLPRPASAPGDLMPKDKPGLIVVGPEGGLEAEEVKLGLEAGAMVLGLGPRILSAHHAAAVALSALLNIGGGILAGF